MFKKTMMLMTCAAVFSLAPQIAQARSFEQFISDIKSEARSKGYGHEAVLALNTISFDPKVIRLDRKQPEHKITFAKYKRNVVVQSRIDKGRALYRKHYAELKRNEARYGVPGKYIVALWAIESNFGQSQGHDSVLQAVATLAYEGRRADFFKKELFAALKIIDKGYAEAEALTGSWAGAMGQCQFMPSSYLRYAVDGDADGMRDIWDNTADVFASMANYLSTEGWAHGTSWGFKVKSKKSVPPQYVGWKAGQPLSVWKQRGFTQLDGSAVSGQGKKYYLVQPDGNGGEQFLVSENYRVIMHWNRSTYFATSVGLLADLIAQ